MNGLKIAALYLLLATLPACGDQLVEYPLTDGGGGGGDDDGDGGDGTPDARDRDAGDDDPGGPPTVTATDPARADVDISVNERIDATFSRAMDPTTLTDITFTVRQGLTEIDGDVTYTARTATFTPDSPLDLSLEYTATITTGAEDPQGSAMADDYVWNFFTGACGLETVDLRTASTFAVLGGSAVTSTGPTTVVGDLGVSPGTSVTGFLPGTVVGDTHANDPAAVQAIADLTTAYDDAAARSLCAVTVAGNLGGQTLAPGLYKSTSSLEITSGDLTLDAEGDDDAIFIFQMASTLTTTSGRQVILAGGATAGNVFWQVGSSATLGTTTAFHGTIMADQAITMGTGASLNGRALARIAAASLDSNAIVVPAL